MRKFLITAAVALTAVAAASPAAAQYYPGQPYPGQYAPYGNAYGYNNGRGLEMRVQQIRNDIRQLDNRNAISRGEARSLDAQARNLQFRARRVAWNGVGPRERYDVERQVNRLQDRVRQLAYNRYGRPGYGNYGYSQPYGYGQQYGYNRNYGYNGYNRERDRDDDDDDNRGYRHDD